MTRGKSGEMAKFVQMNKMLVFIANNSKNWVMDSVKTYYEQPQSDVIEVEVNGIICQSQIEDPIDEPLG